MRLQQFWAFLSALVVLTAVAHARKNSPSTGELPAATAFVHVNVIPMDRERILSDQTVVVQRGRITQIGPANKVKVKSGTQTINGKGKYLMPGLVDAHVHLESQTEFALYLANGVTTVFNLDGRPAHLLWQKQIASGELLGPTIFSTGPIFHQKRSPDEDVKLVDEQAAAGYDAVKIYNEVSGEEYPALIAEAKRKNMLLMGHVARGPGFAATLAAGQSVAHLEEFIYTNFNPQHDDDFDHLVFDETKIPAIVRETKAANIYVTATLDNFAKIVQQATDLDTFLKNPELRYVAPWTVENFQPQNDRYKNRFQPRQYEILRNLLAIQRKMLKALGEDGVPLMTGTDATEVGPVSGFGLHHELQEFVNDGLSPYQALTAATTTPQRYLRQATEAGTVETGKRADLLLLAGNPLEDISSTQKIVGVMVRGRWQDEKQLRVNLDRVPEEYQREVREVASMLRQDPGKAARYFSDHDPLGSLAAYTIAEVAPKESVADLVNMLQQMRMADPHANMVSENSMNTLGYALLNKGLNPQAIAVLSLNTENFPRSANTWDSLAEAFAHSGETAKAVANYEKALATDSGYPNKNLAKKFIAEHAQK